MFQRWENYFTLGRELLLCLLLLLFFLLLLLLLLLTGYVSGSLKLHRYRFLIEKYQDFSMRKESRKLVTKNIVKNR